MYIYNITQSLQLSQCAREFLPELIQFGLDKLHAFLVSLPVDALALTV